MNIQMLSKILTGFPLPFPFKKQIRSHLWIPDLVPTPPGFFPNSKWDQNCWPRVKPYPTSWISCQPMKCHTKAPANQATCSVTSKSFSGSAGWASRCRHSKLVVFSHYAMMFCDARKPWLHATIQFSGSLLALFIGFLKHLLYGRCWSLLKLCWLCYLFTPVTADLCISCPHTDTS